MAKQKHIMEAAYQLFSDKGIIPVTITDVAAASGVGRSTVFRYFSTKLDLVIAVGTWKWEEYIEARNASLSQDDYDRMTGAEHLRFLLDGFLDLYRNHADILRFNYDFNSFLRYELGTPEQKQPYYNVMGALGDQFHRLYERGIKDGTLCPEIPETTMLSSTYHIMLATTTRYAVGLVIVYENSIDPEGELVMLEELLLSRFLNPQPVNRR